MLAIITGGTGLIGRALTADLVASGYEVVVLSRSPERRAGLPAAARLVRWNGATAEGWGALADGAHAIVNLAGESIAEGRWTPERKRRIRESRLGAGQAVVEAVSAAACAAVAARPDRAHAVQPIATCDACRTSGRILAMSPSTM